MGARSWIRVFGARQYNLKNINVEIPRGEMTVITGLSGSGKSSLAFDTIFAEGQRKYVESLSTYARQFLDQLPKPDVDRIEGLSPTIAIEQRVGMVGPRSTVGTLTEVLDYLRVLFARVGAPACWKCGLPIQKQSTAEIVDAVLGGSPGRRIMVLAPLVQDQKGGHKALLDRVLREAFVRARIDGKVVELEAISTLAAHQKHTIEVVVDRLVTKAEITQRLADSVEVATRLSNGRVLITEEKGDGTWSDTAFSSALACPVHPEIRLEELSPQLFSFNSPQGACEECHGLGVRLNFDTELVVPDPKLSLREGAIAAWRRQGRRLNALYAEQIEEFCKRFQVLPDVPFANLPADARRILMNGTTKSDAEKHGASFEGVLPNLKRRWQATESDSAKHRLHSFLDETPCARCGGTRLNERARCVRVADRTLADVTCMTVVAAADYVLGLTFQGESKVIAEPLVREMKHRLTFLQEVGVRYLTLDRPVGTLSGGEFQRIRLATQIGGGLSGVCYVLDEPTIGLHTRDTRQLTAILRNLAEMDNTVIVVEHDEEVIRGADYWIDIGPVAGAKGGELLAQGPFAEVLRSTESITARFVRGDARMEVRGVRRSVDWGNAIELRGVTTNNLKGVDVHFPLGCLVAVTGVSGSGKSTLVSQVLLRAMKRALGRAGPKPGAFGQLLGAERVQEIVEVDQSPIGRTPRSNPATFVGVFGMIRELFARTREAKIRGYGPNRFSFNVKGGRCEHCEGQGTKRITMHFLPDVFVTCGACGGTRFNRETLEIRYRGKTIADVLDFCVSDAVSFFENFNNIRRRLDALSDVGLGYITLGQASNTLSGGEAQRVKLAAELHRAVEGHTLYILDEPTTGLHPADVQHLLVMLQRLVDRGMTVLVIEHNLDVIHAADWVVDLGPEGGDEGGRVVVEGTPEAVAECEASHTGAALRDRLCRNS